MIINTIYTIEKAISDYLTFSATNTKGLRYEDASQVKPVTVEVRQGSIEYDKASYPSVIFYDSNLDIGDGGSLYQEPKTYLPEFSKADYESGELDTIVFRPIISSRGVFLLYNFEVITKKNIHIKDILMQFITLFPMNYATAMRINFGENRGYRDIYISYEGMSREQDEFKGSLRIFRRVLKYKISLPVFTDMLNDYKEYALSLKGRFNAYQVPSKGGVLDKENKVLDNTINVE